MGHAGRFESRDRSLLLPSCHLSREKRESPATALSRPPGFRKAVITLLAGLIADNFPRLNRSRGTHFVAEHGEQNILIRHFVIVRAGTLRRDRPILVVV